MAVLKSIGWRSVMGVVGIPVAIGVSRGIAEVWIALRPDNPPRRPTDPDVAWSDALAWAALSAVGVAVGQIATTKGATSVWRGLTGSEPPRPKAISGKKQAKRSEKKNDKASGKAEKIAGKIA